MGPYSRKNSPQKTGAGRDPTGIRLTGLGVPGARAPRQAAAARQSTVRTMGRAMTSTRAQARATPPPTRRARPQLEGRRRPKTPAPDQKRVNKAGSAVRPAGFQRTKKWGRL